MKRRSLLLGILSAVTFGMIERPKPVDGSCQPSRRQVFCLTSCGLALHNWDGIKSGEYLLIQDCNEFGLPFRQEAFIAKTAPHPDDPTGRVECDPIPLDAFWALARNYEAIRLSGNASCLAVVDKIVLEDEEGRWPIQIQNDWCDWV